MPKKISAKTKKAGSEVISLAKKYARAHPAAKWSSAMKHAGVEYRKKHHK